MLDPEEEIHGEIVESDGLLGQPREGILHVYDGNKGIFRILFFLSIALNVFFAEFGLAHWILSRQKTAPSYENGFASDLGGRALIIIPHPPPSPPTASITTSA